MESTSPVAMREGGGEGFPEPPSKREFLLSFPYKPALSPLPSSPSHRAAPDPSCVGGCADDVNYYDHCLSPVSSVLCLIHAEALPPLPVVPRRPPGKGGVNNPPPPESKRGFSDIPPTFVWLNPVIPPRVAPPPRCLCPLPLSRRLHHPHRTRTPCVGEIYASLFAFLVWSSVLG